MVVTIVLLIALTLAYVAQLLRWLRVLQREHYDPTSMWRFLVRWSTPPLASARSVERHRRTRPVSWSHVFLIGLFIATVTQRPWAIALVSVAYGLVCPVGLSFKGRTSPLHWTPRARRIAIVDGLLTALVTALGTLAKAPVEGLAVAVWLVPLTLNMATRLLGPSERRRSNAFVTQARQRLERIAPTVVAITGSYGKTSTKNHLDDLLRPDGGVVASPRSFNNRAGLSRAINENLTDDARIFIAEMGTYGPGEIADLCAWCPPRIAVVTAIGPVHLERMKSLDVIESAKWEITQRATTVVLNVDDPRLVHWPARLGDRRIRRASSISPADVQVAVEGAMWRLRVDGVDVDTRPAMAGLQPTNVACAIAAALEVECSIADVVARWGSLRSVEHRQEVSVAPSGVTIIDDTFNANPASATASLERLSRLDIPGRRVVVTPGLIELGPEQYIENVKLATQIVSRGAEVVIVGLTNAVALLAGSDERAPRVATRDDAVAWVRATLGQGDAVLYLNDLPDHYP